MSASRVRGLLGEPIRVEPGLWHYPDRAVVFRDDRVVQVLGQERLFARRAELPESTPGIRTRLGAVVRSRALDFDLEGDVVSDLVERGRGNLLRWTASSLRRALWECLSPAYPDVTPHLWPGLLIATRSDSGPAELRCRLMAEAATNRSRRSGLRAPLVALDEVTDEECQQVEARLRLVAFRKPGSLRTAAALARILDAGYVVRPIIYPDPDPQIFELGYALAGGRFGKPWWINVAGAESEFDPRSAEERFHILSTPIGAKLRPRSRDGLRPVRQTLDDLRGICVPVPDWSSTWASELPGCEAERDLLRLIERFPNEDRDCHHLTTLTTRTAQAAAAWLGSARSPDQRLLAAGLAHVLTVALEVLGV